MEKLYVIVRADLAPGLQIAQACHAVQTFCLAHPTTFHNWAAGPGNLVVLHAPDQMSLGVMAKTAAKQGALTAAFNEPDLGNELTAIALCGMSAHKLLSQLPLALNNRWLTSWSATCKNPSSSEPSQTTLSGS